MKTETLIAVALAVVAALIVVRLVNRPASSTTNPTAGMEDGGY